METLSEAHDDSSGANPSSVKSEDGSPPPDGDRGSPPPNCAICLGRCRNKSFTDSCLHQFCFKCLVTWSKVKTECPLCKQVFKSIIHNVQSNHQYEEYRVEQRLHETDRIEINDLVTATRRFRYRTTLTFPRGRDHIALQRLLMHYPPLTAMVGMSRDLPGITPAALPSSRRRRSPSSFRRTVYRHNLWARPLPDFTGRHRDCTPEFYRYNDSQMHRLVPWLDRELHYLLLENAGHITYVQSRILDLLPRYHITSPEFRAELYRYLGARTDHFLHELHCFASTPYDLTGYDRNVQYTTDSRISNAVSDVLSSSDTESGDSDIVVVNEPPHHAPYRPFSPAPAYDQHPGPSAPVYPRHHIAPVDEARRTLVIPIETISHSDTDDDEVMVTGYIKPPSQRTPEVVDLRDSDSDVVLTEDPAQQARGLVQLMLSRAHPPRPAPSGSDSGSYTPPPPPPPPPEPRARRRSSSSSYCPSSERDYSPSLTPSPRRAPRFSSDESSSPERDASPVRRNKRKRTRRSRDADRERDAVPPPPPAPHRTPERDPREKDKRKKSKSTNGKGVKSSRKADAAPVRAAPSQEEPQPGPSSRTDGEEERLFRRDHATDTRVTESTSAREDPRPEPLLLQSEPSTSRPEPSTSRPEPTSSRPEPTSSRPTGMLVKLSKRNDNLESRRAGSAPEVQEAPQRRTSSSRPVKQQKRSRQNEVRESQKAEFRAVAQPTSRVEGGGTSGTSKRKNTDETSARRNSRESKRLKSVVKKASSWSSAIAGSSSAGSASPAGASASSSFRASSTKPPKRNISRKSSDSDASAPSSPDFTDSDDDIPLNLTIKRSAGRP